MWNRTGRDRRRGQGQGSPFPAPPNPGRRWQSLTFQLLLAEAVELLLVHVHLDGSEVGHDGQEILEVDLIRQPIRLLPQVPGGSKPTVMGSPSQDHHTPSKALSLGFG